MKKSVFIGAIVLFIFLLIAVPLVMFLLFSFDYRSPEDFRNFKKMFKNPHLKLPNIVIISSYTILQGMHLIVFVGFGFLMTYLKKYGRSSLAFTLLLSSVVFLWYLLLDGFFYMKTKYILISMASLIRAELAAVVFLISFSAVIGKFNILQFLLMAFLETPIYAGNKYLTEEVLMVTDCGGCSWIHMFGASFGLGVSLIHGLRGGPREYKKTDLELSSYESDIFAMIGTLFLWVFWPLLNASSSSGFGQSRAFINTYLSLAMGCFNLFTFLAFQAENNPDHKFNLIFVHRSSLAAGIAIASVANLKIDPIDLFFPGILAISLSILSYIGVQSFLSYHLRIHDTSGVFSFHAVPAIVGSIEGIIRIIWATRKNYGEELYILYPAMKVNERSKYMQMIFQFCSIFTSMGIGFAGGLLTGCLIVMIFPNLPESELYVDEHHWEVDEND